MKFHWNAKRLGLIRVHFQAISDYFVPDDHRITGIEVDNSRQCLHITLEGPKMPQYEIDQPSLLVHHAYAEDCGEKCPKCG